MKDFFDYIDGMLDRVIIGKKAKFDKDILISYNKEKYEFIFENIVLGKMHDYVNKDYYTFYFKEFPMTITTYYFDYIEYNEKIEKLISEELGIQQEKVQSINRIITGVLAGFE